jgi:O-Antigen ligase
VGFVGRYGPALLVGLVMAGIAAFDFPLGRAVGLRDVPIPDVSPGWRVNVTWVEVPYLFSGLFLALSASVCLLVRNFHWIWDSRIKILLVLVILTPQMSSIAIGNLESSDLIVPLFLYIICLDLFMGEKPIISPAILLILPLLGIMLLSCVHLGFRPLFFFVKEAKFLAIPFIVILALRNRELLHFAVKALIVTLAVSALIGLIQEVVFLSTGVVLVGYLTESHREVYLFEDTSFGKMMRAQGFFGVPGLFGTGMAVAGTLVLYLLLAKEPGLFKRRTLLYPTFCVVVTALVLSFNRPAAVAFFVAAVIALYLAKPSLCLHITAVLLFLGVAGIVVGIASPRLTDKVVGEVRTQARYTELRERIVFNRRSLIGAFTKHPIIGVGLGLGFRYTHDVRQWPAHSSPIQAVADLGILGAVAYLSIFIVAMVRLLGVALDVGRQAEHRYLAKALLVGFIAMSLHMLVEPFFYKMSLAWVYLGVTEGLTVLPYRETRSVVEEVLWRG